MGSKMNQLDNPSTAIIPESRSDLTHAQKSTPKKKKRRREKKFEPNFNIPGVHKLILQETTQRAVGCVAGDTVTTEKPWTHVDKDAIQEHIELHVESSEFLPLKDQLVEFPRSEVLVGYIPDESKEYDEFYVCVTEEATEQVDEIIEKLKRMQEERLKNAVHKRIKRWRSLGSEKEVEETAIKLNRPLIEVEIESKYPILPFKVKYKLTKAEDMRDGYMELRSSDESLATIYRKRIDAFVQVAPSVVTNEAQTVCTYPKNSYTQYEYKVPEVSLEDSQKYFEDLASEKLDSLCDILNVNGCIDLYSNDYENLVLDEKYTMKVVSPEASEYFSFIDMNLCKGKMISSVAWHPMWTGCVITSYVNVAPSIYLPAKRTADVVFNAVHDKSPVIFWSFQDDLKPKLILETPRPVHTLSCCPYDPNIVIGGCVNGQLILWDITNKLNSVEEEEILTVEQQKYRHYLFSLMDWMKNIYDATRVRPTAMSDLKYSHAGCVNYITWMSPFHTVSKTGKIKELEEGRHSLELLTSADDGTIMIWDLLRKPIVAPGGFKATRRLKRLKKKPSALLVMESPFKILHMNLKPTYKINLINPSENSRQISIASCYMGFFKTTYEQATRESRRLLKLSDRLIYKPVLRFENSNARQTFYVGTMEGDFIQGMWDGQEFDSGEVVNFEDAGYVNSGKYHDGPVVSIDYATTLDTILTVGGKIFALWQEPFKNRPLLWRKSKSIYTYGSWFLFEEASIKLTRMDGYSEVWTLFQQSKSPLTSTLMSNGAVNILSCHPRKLKNDVLALCDYRGCLKLFCNKHLSPIVIKAKEEAMSYFLTRELERKKLFLTWQEEWNERHRAPTQVVEEEEEGAGLVFEEPVEHKKKEEKKKVVKISPGQRYLQAVQEQHRLNEQERIKSIILMKKQLDTEDLLKKSAPLRKLEEENEYKKKKQKTVLKESDKIFKEQVAMLFPDVVRVKPPPPPDPYQDFYEEDDKHVNFNQYHELAISAQDYVEEHPFSYDFSWGTVLKTGRERRKKLDDSGDKDRHRMRYAKIKEDKARLSAETVSSKAEQTQGTPSLSIISEF